MAANGSDPLDTVRQPTGTQHKVEGMIKPNALRYQWKWYRAAQLASGLLAVSIAAGNANAETLEQYAAKCDAAIAAGTPFTPEQVTVPDFNCEVGTLVPTTNSVTDPVTNRVVRCDRPNVLNRACDPGSRFQVLRRDPYVVAHCRKENGKDGLYGDIAVIQWNEDNGATCFYQALGNQLQGDMAGTNVQAPSEGTGIWPSPPPQAPQPTPGVSRWLSPTDTANTNCAACHDNGQIIRSPYLAQLRDDPNFLPGTKPNEMTTFNKDQPYNFVGEDFKDWNTYNVHVEGNICVSCHRMGINNLRNSLGTARDFGPLATAASQPAKNPHSEESPIWMPPGQITFAQAFADAAAAIAACAGRVRIDIDGTVTDPSTGNEIPLPNEQGPGGCQITRFSGVVPPPPDPGVPGTLQFSAAPNQVSEGDGSAIITVARTGGSSGQVSVDFTTVVGPGAGTATDGADYIFTDGTLTWANGDTADKSFTLPIFDDTDVEEDETVNLSLSNPTGGALLGKPAMVVLTITDNEAAVAPLCGGLTPTINGATEGDDLLNGTAGPDVIHGRGGNDVIRGLRGNDTICGGRGIDTLSGGRGSDRLFGQPGRDFLFGQRSNDALDGGRGFDLCIGGPGRDTVVRCERVRNLP